MGLRVVRLTGSGVRGGGEGATCTGGRGRRRRLRQPDIGGGSISGLHAQKVMENRFDQVLLLVPIVVILGVVMVRVNHSQHRHRITISLCIAAATLE